MCWLFIKLEGFIIFGMGEEFFILGCSAEWTLETFSCSIVVFIF